MKVHFFCRFVVPTNSSLEADTRLMSYFTTTFLMVICSAFLEVVTTLTSHYTTKLPMDIFTLYVDVKADIYIYIDVYIQGVDK